VISISQVIASVIAGCAVSCGATLAVAGAGKLYRAARGLDDTTAIRRALRMPRHRWRHLTWAAGGVECAAGVLVCSGTYPAVGGASMAVLGAVFCALLGYVLVQRVPGGCGCIRWGATAEAADSVTWRSVARGALLSAAGAADALVRADAAAASQRGWFMTGVVTGGIALVGLSVRMPARTPFCRRPLLRQTQAMLGALARYETFAAMAASAGPFSPVVRHRRTGCTDEFWFTPADGQASQAVIFRVNHSVNSPLPAVHVSLWDSRAPAVSWPDRTVTMSGRRPITTVGPELGLVSAQIKWCRRAAGRSGGIYSNVLGQRCPPGLGNVEGGVLRAFGRLACRRRSGWRWARSPPGVRGAVASAGALRG